MQIVIDVPEGTKLAIDMGTINQVLTSKVWAAIKNGTPLPKHHGDLIDRNELLKQYGLENATKYGNKDAEQQKHSYSTMMMYEIADMIEDAETIIPATKEEKQTERKCESCKYHDGRGGCLDSCALCRYTPKQTATKEGDGKCKWQ